jgi:hypothetical protein
MIELDLDTDRSDFGFVNRIDESGRSQYGRLVEIPQTQIHICGGELCFDGKPHDDDGPPVEFENGGSTSCSRCGSAAIDRMWFL